MLRPDNIKKIKRTVVGCIDPYHEVQGGGISRMREAGVDVTVGVLEKECIEMNKRFFSVQNNHRPYVILKWAETSDGHIDIERPAELPPAWMTGARCKTMVHGWRAEEDAIMVGRKTVELDNPSLTVREVEGRNPIRVTLDRNLTLETSRNIFDDQATTILFTSQENQSKGVKKFESNKTVEVETLDYSQPILPQVMHTLYCRRVQSLFVEGGTELIQSFINENLWDETRIFISPLASADLYPSIRNPKGIHAPKICMTGARAIEIDNVTLYVIEK